jgi:protoporphyrinogen oxidase
MKVGIVGAGVTGLTAAYELGKRGHEVSVYEAEPVAGGLSAGFHVSRWEWTLDRFYRHVFAGDQEIIDLADELGVALTFSRPTTSMWVNGEPYAYDSPIAAALYPNLPLLLNLRVGAVIAYLKYVVRDGTRLERRTAHEWLQRTMGRRAYRELWEPMLRGKFKDEYDQVNMAWFWARFAARTPRLGYFDGGFQVLINRLVVAIRKQGGKVYLQTPVEKVLSDGDGVTLRLAEGTSARCDRVLTTVSPTKLVSMADDLPQAFVHQVGQLKSMGAVILILALERSVLTDGTYWLNLPEGEFPCLSMVEHTNYQDRAYYAGDVIVYLGDYLPVGAPEMAMETEALYARYREALIKVQPAFENGWVKDKWSFREHYAQPVPEINHSQRIPAAERPIVPDVYWACLHHVYPWDRGTNFAVELGQRVAGAIDG